MLYITFENSFHHFQTRIITPDTCLLKMPDRQARTVRDLGGAGYGQGGTFEDHFEVERFRVVDEGEVPHGDDEAQLEHGDAVKHRRLRVGRREARRVHEVGGLQQGALWAEPTHWQHLTG